MTEDRIHRAISPDGIEIAGRVVGHGPPLVLVHGALYDGETAWTEMLPHLTDRFTCYLPSTRGRGLSGDHSDYSSERLLGDVTAFVDSVGQPVPVVGWSGGGMWALGAAARSRAVSAVVAYEPAVFEVIDAETSTRFERTVARMAEQAKQGQLLEAARTFTALVATEEEQRAIFDSGRLEYAAPNIPVDLRVFAGVGQSSGPSPTDPALLSTITVPVLLLHGDHTASSWFIEGVRHVAAYAPDCQVRTVHGAGHSAPGLLPQAVATEIVRFLEPARQPV